MKVAAKNLNFEEAGNCVTHQETAPRSWWAVTEVIHIQKSKCKQC